MTSASQTMGSERRAQLLVIDDDTIQRMIVREVAAKIGYDTTGAASYEEAADLLGQGDYDCITLDLSLGRRSGIDVLHLFKEIRCETPIIVMSGKSEAISMLAVGIGTLAKLKMCPPIPKPVDLEVLSETLAKIKRESDAKPKTVLSLVGWSTEPTPTRKAG